jgi:hypothetical protein
MSKNRKIETTILWSLPRGHVVIENGVCTYHPGMYACFLFNRKRDIYLIYLIITNVCYI